MDNTRASEVIKRLRALAGKDELKLGSTNLNEAVREVINIAKNDLLVKNVSVTMELDADMPPVRGDRIQLEQIFTPFYTTKSGGLGMGLAISRSIIEAHGGRIWSLNNQGRGATFFFTMLIHEG